MVPVAEIVFIRMTYWHRDRIRRIGFAVCLKCLTMGGAACQEKQCNGDERTPFDSHPTSFLQLRDGLPLNSKRTHSILTPYKNGFGDFCKSSAWSKLKTAFFRQTCGESAQIVGVPAWFCYAAQSDLAENSGVPGDLDFRTPGDVKEFGGLA